jgi:mono/diheme cytochrome c family protein
MMVGRLLLGAAASFIAIAAVSAAPPGGEVQQPPAVLAESLAGSDSFELYCAACHGEDGRGAGPVARALRTRPADLTTLARRNGGSFPAAQTRAFVTGTGRELAAHGSTEMPVWGPMFRAFESDARTRERIDNLVAYIATLQQPTSAAGQPGAQLFRTHCASCHGADARGAGPMATELRTVPPDLTTFAMRNQGVFPSERVRAIVDGRGVAAHGSREMPIWGDAFRAAREGLTGAEAAARIDAIVGYLQTIQQRPAE